MLGLAAMVIGDRIRLAFASSYGKVMVGDLGRDGPVWPNYFRAYEEWGIPQTVGEYVNALACTRANDRHFLAAGTEYGRLAVWDFETGELIANRSGAHLEDIPVLAFGDLGLVSGGQDGFVRVWSHDLETQLEIEVGHPITALAAVEGRRLAVGTSRGILLLHIPE
jgi:WD40 repeat protein